MVIIIQIYAHILFPPEPGDAILEHTKNEKLTEPLLILLFFSTRIVAITIMNHHLFFFWFAIVVVFILRGEAS